MEENKDTRTEFDELGEFGLIDQLTQDFPLRNASSLKGVGSMPRSSTMRAIVPWFQSTFWWKASIST